MKTAMINVKVDEQTKKRAQAVAGAFGVPLSTLINAYLMELAETGQIHFGAVEMVTPEMEKLIEEAEKEIKSGETVGPFETAEEAIAYLNNF